MLSLDAFDCGAVTFRQGAQQLAKVAVDADQHPSPGSTRLPITASIPARDAPGTASVHAFASLKHRARQARTSSST